jgi:hypothetical protein
VITSTFSWCEMEAVVVIRVQRLMTVSFELIMGCGSRLEQDGGRKRWWFCS